VKLPNNPFLRSAALAAAIVICLGQAAHAGTYYWDTNDSTAGFGTASGTWGTSTFWSTAAAGTASTANTTITTADNVNFGTTSNPLVVGNNLFGPTTAQGFLTMTFGNPSGAGNAIGLVNGTLNLASTSTITTNNNANSISTVLQGSGSNLIKSGTGSLSLQGSSANTYTGLTTVNAGTLTLNKTAGVTAIAGNVLVTTGTLTNGAADQIADTATVTLNSPSAKWALGTFSETVANVDVLNAATTASNGLATGNAGKLTVTGTLTHTLGDITLNSAGVGFQSTITANTVINTGGTWTFGVANGTQSLVVGSGGLTIGGGSTIAVNAKASVASTLNNNISLGGNVTSQENATSNRIIGGADGAGKLNLNATRTFDVADGAAASDLTISTIVANGTGTGAITKTGAGTMTLSGVNTYTGDTTVAGGTLGLGASATISSTLVLGTATPAQGTLDVTAKSSFSQTNVSGSGTINIGTGKTVTVTGNFVPGFSPGVVNVTGNLAFANSTSTTMEIAGAGDVGGVDQDFANVSGALTLDGALSIVAYNAYNLTTSNESYNLFDAASITGYFDSVNVGGTALVDQTGGIWKGTSGITTYEFTQGTGVLTVVPESGAALLGGLGTLLLLRRRRN